MLTSAASGSPPHTRPSSNCEAEKREKGQCYGRVMTHGIQLLGAPLHVPQLHVRNRVELVLLEIHFLPGEEENQRFAVKSGS